MSQINPASQTGGSLKPRNGANPPFAAFFAEELSNVGGGSQRRLHRAGRRYRFGEADMGRAILGRESANGRSRRFPLHTTCDWRRA